MRRGAKRNRCVVGGILFVCLACAAAPAAEPPVIEWEKTFAFTPAAGLADTAYHVEQMTGGGYIVCGAWYHVPTGFLLKTNSIGDQEWRKFFGNEIRYVQQTADGGFVASGESSGDQRQFYLLKTDAIGNIAWERTFGEGCAWSVQQTADGGYIAGGHLGPYWAQSSAFLVKADANGNAQWSKSFPQYKVASMTRSTHDEGYIVTGWTPGPEQGFVLKTDASGNAQSSTTLTTAGTLLDTQQTTDGGYFACGSAQTGAYLATLDAAGNVLWQRTFGGPAAQGFRGHQTSDGGFVVAGQLDNFFAADATSVYVVKTDPNGNLEWEKLIGGLVQRSRSKGWRVQQTHEGGYIVCGSKQEDYWVNPQRPCLIKLAGVGPPAPKGVAASDGTFSDKVRVSWQASAGATAYRVFRTGTSFGTKTAVSNWVAATTFDDTPGAVVRSYCYWVKARNAKGESDYSIPDWGWRAMTPTAVRPSWRLYR